MKRRDFIAALGGAAAMPLVARAQQQGKLPIIGFLSALTPSAASQWRDAFVQRLRELGWIEGRTVAIEYRWLEGRLDRAGEIAAEFVRLKVDVIVTHATAPVIAAKQATSTIPIVFAMKADPVGAGLVASLARPGGNVTGLSNQQTDLAGKRLEMLREVVPESPPVGDHGQCRQSRRHAGCARSSGGGRHARPRRRHVRYRASGGYRARFRGAQGPRGGALCLLATRS